MSVEKRINGAQFGGVEEGELRDFFSLRILCM